MGEHYVAPGSTYDMPLVFNDIEGNEHKGEQLLWYDNIEGEGDPFETKTFTVTVDDTKNKNATTSEKGVLTSYMADVDTDADFVGDTEAISADGKIFEESKHRSAPYFDVQIDGITLLNAKF